MPLISVGEESPDTPGLGQKTFHVTLDIVTSPSFICGYPLVLLGFKNSKKSFKPTELNDTTDATKVRHMLKFFTRSELKIPL